MIFEYIYFSQCHFWHTHICHWNGLFSWEMCPFIFQIRNLPLLLAQVGKYLPLQKQHMTIPLWRITYLYRRGIDLFIFLTYRHGRTVSSGHVYWVKQSMIWVNMAKPIGGCCIGVSAVSPGNVHPRGYSHYLPYTETLEIDRYFVSVLY